MKNTKTILHALLILIGLLSFNTQAGVEITYMHNDALGSAVAGTDAQGNVKWRSHYQPYGTEMLGQRVASGARAGFTGHRDDPESGLTYMGARYYSPAMGRFMGMDPAGVSESNLHSFNRFAYANNNPYKFVDPDGENPVLALERALWAGGRVGAGINAAVYHFAGVTLSTMLANAAWNILNNENADDNSTGTVEDLLDGTVPDDNSKSPKSKKRRELDGGGIDAANKKFDKVKPKNVRNRGKGVRTGKLDDGSIITVRPLKTPTVSINEPGKKKNTKIRF